VKERERERGKSGVARKIEIYDRNYKGGKPRTSVLRNGTHIESNAIQVSDMYARELRYVKRCGTYRAVASFAKLSYPLDTGDSFLHRYDIDRGEMHAERMRAERSREDARGKRQRKSELPSIRASSVIKMRLGKNPWGETERKRERERKDRVARKL